MNKQRSSDRRSQEEARRAGDYPKNHLSAIFQAATLSDSDGVVVSTIVATVDVHKACTQTELY